MAFQHLIYTALKQSALVFVLADRSGQILYANPAFESQTGYRPQEMVGKPVQMLAEANDRAGLGASILLALQEGQSWDGRIAVLRKEGPVLQSQATLWPVLEDTGAIEAVACVFRDITAEVNLEAQLRTSQKLEAIGQLASGIAHEINTPTQYIGDNIRFFEQSMNDLQGLLESFDCLLQAAAQIETLSPLTREIEAYKRQIDYDYLVKEVPLAVQQSLEGNQRVAEIVRAMKEFAHPGSDAYEPVDVNHTIMSTLAVSRNEWKYVADVETDLGADLPPLVCDPSAFSQVILNLCVNAAHAMEEMIEKRGSKKGKLRIQTRRVENRIEIRISDTGPGIPAGIRERIFEPFFTTKDVGKGTGQGLALAHSVIVDKLKGAILLESETGEGTTFVLQVPAGFGGHQG
ncbi:MAG: PAS domain S-box protein [Candidatus Hydrogenedentes bacterium]|nr:PAS domain S-box protein [Candidatus Hydrogenedentota bacterium]